MNRLSQSLQVRKQPAFLVLMGWVVLAILVVLPQTAFTYQQQEKQFPEPVNGGKLTQTIFTYQGQLKEDGAPANGTYSFRFTLYAAQRGGQELSSITKDDVLVTNGSFAVQLDLNSAAFDGKENWLEVAMRPGSSMEPYTVLSPRQRLTATPYAILAQGEPWSLIGVPVGFAHNINTDIVASDKIADNGVANAQNVGERMVKSSDLLKDHETPVAGSNVAMALLGTPNFIAKFDGSGNPTVNSIMFDNGTNVGIGTTSPGALLDFSSATAQDKIHFGANDRGIGVSSDGGVIIWGDASSATPIAFKRESRTAPNDLVIAANGNVGVGTAAPTHTLHVNGQARVGLLGLNNSLNDVVVADSNGVLHKRDASTIGANAWLLTGNTVTPGQFLGTMNNAALEVRVNNMRALLITPASTPNLIAGFNGNSATAGVVGTTISGGGDSGFGNNRVTDDFGTVGGGSNNRAGDNAGTTSDQRFATVGGGLNNTASSFTATVAGGENNTASGSRSTVSGGQFNTASNFGSTVSGGANNTASGLHSTVPGGNLNTAAGDFSSAAGFKAKANHQGAFVWADFPNVAAPDFASTAANQFNVRASGGTRIFSDSAATVGVMLAPGGNSWSAISDRNVKENFVPVDGRLILQKLSRIPITQWNLKSQDPSIKHIGPMAQDFYVAFGLGESERHISTIDADGIALVSIQALYEMSLEKDKKIEELQQRIEKLEKLVETLTKK